MELFGFWPAFSKMRSRPGEARRIKGACFYYRGTVVEGIGRSNPVSSDMPFQPPWFFPSTNRRQRESIGLIHTARLPLDPSRTVTLIDGEALVLNPGNGGHRGTYRSVSGIHFPVCRLMRELGVVAIPPKTRFANGSLCVSQGNHWVHFRRAPGWNVAG